jgi:hypothetical protein
VARSGDQQVIEAFSAQRTDPSFGDGVRPWRSDRGADDGDVGAGEDRVEGGGELAVPIADQEPELGGLVAVSGSRTRLPRLTCGFKLRARTR